MFNIGKYTWILFAFKNYFDRLRRKTREIDEGIKGLADTWQMPELFVGGYAERTAETNACLEELWDSIRSTDVAVEKFQSEIKPSLDEIDQLLKESQAMYEDLKDQCDNLDIVLTEYGYHYEESNGSENHSRNSSQDCINDNLLINEEMPDVEVEFTPDLTWKCKAKSRESDSSIASQRNPMIKSIATPVIKSLKSVLQSESFRKESHIDNTSVQESNCSKQITKVSKR